MLTTKITCLVREVVDGVVDMNSNGTSMSKWYTVNVTGGAPGSQPLSPPIEEGQTPDTDEEEGEEDTSLFD
jgi:hypothetical protein